MKYFGVTSGALCTWCQKINDDMRRYRVLYKSQFLMILWWNSTFIFVLRENCGTTCFVCLTFVCLELKHEVDCGVFFGFISHHIFHCHQYSRYKTYLVIISCVTLLAALLSAKEAFLAVWHSPIMFATSATLSKPAPTSSILEPKSEIDKSGIVPHRHCHMSLR